MFRWEGVSCQREKPPVSALVWQGVSMAFCSRVAGLGIIAQE